MKSTPKLIFALIVIIVIAAIGYFVTHKGAPTASMQSTAEWQTHTNDIYGFQVSYPADWIVRDDLTTATSTCCLFVAHWVTSTTTLPAATSTPGATSTDAATGTPRISVTSREMIKLQIGPYDRTKLDPFKSGTTTAITLDGQTFYAGEAGAMQFYLLPRTDNDGIGAAIYPYLETPQSDIQMAKQIVGTMKFTN